MGRLLIAITILSSFAVPCGADEPVEVREATTIDACVPNGPVLDVPFAAPCGEDQAVKILAVPTAGQITFGATIENHRVDVELVTAAAPAWWPDWLAVGCYIEACSHISKLSVKVDGSPIHVPDNTFQSLFVVHAASLTPSRDGFLLKVYGSSDAETYWANFIFDFGVMGLREFSLTQPTGYGSEERRIYEDGIWQCEKQAKGSESAC